ncbi:MAG TPA: F0F1 ATP synthase subunit epsilon [Candidatus Enterosoma merdigallinarum]|nr:F0F1 ATP synthase subunit epsilon [Candidatus Enterosoma merdigallinarum]
METFQLEIITPLRKYASLQVESLSVDTHFGQISVYAHHGDMIANVEISPLVMHYNGSIRHFAVSGGVLYCLCKENKVQLIVNAIESYDEIDIQRAIAEKVAAEKLLINAKSVKEYNQAEIALKRAINRINVKERFKY